MKDEENYEEFDNIMKKFIMEAIENLHENESEKSFSEKLFNELFKKHNIPIEEDTYEDIVEISYEELVREIKRELLKRHGSWIDKEIEELEKKLKK